MPAYTPFLTLYKPGGGSTGLIVPDEVVDIDRLNANSDLIDAFAAGWGHAAERNHQLYGPAASRSAVTGMKRGDTYQESDGSFVIWRFDGVDWVKELRVVRFNWVRNAIPDATLISDAVLTVDPLRTTDATVAPVISGTTVRLQPGLYLVNYGIIMNRVATGLTFLESSGTLPQTLRQHIPVSGAMTNLSGTFYLDAQTDATFRAFLTTGAATNATGDLLIAKIS
jgi:hypothetical protein